MLTTEVSLKFEAGSGGNGKISFRKNKKGPDGGNGGRGGSIYIKATSNIYALSNLHTGATVKAVAGEGGMRDRSSGHNAPDLEVELPLGSVVTDTKTQEVFEVLGKNDRFLLCEGGRGGKGNWEYRSSRNTTPRYAQWGGKGQQRSVSINLKLIADYGLIGLPNAGKSSLLKELTSANPKIGSYPFTTLEPNLGELNGKVLADIPGLIEGASRGKGLGIKFLKHIEKVSLLLHCISCEEDDPKKVYFTILKELEEYNPKLLEIAEVILLTKSDLISEKEVKERLYRLQSLKKPILPISIHNFESIEKLKVYLANLSS